MYNLKTKYIILLNTQIQFIKGSTLYILTGFHNLFNVWIRY